MLSLSSQLNNYVPFNSQEQADLEVLKDSLIGQRDVFTRSNKVCHFTASSWIVSRNYDKVIMIYHNIYNSWSWTGGHADGETDLLSVAVREAKEETGLSSIQPVSSDIYSVEVLTVNSHVKNQQVVSSHLHLNVTYLLVADTAEPLVVNQQETSGVKWVNISEAVGLCCEVEMKPIYQKLIDKMPQFISAKSNSTT